MRPRRFCRANSTGRASTPDAARVGPHDRKAGHETRPRIEHDHARTCRQFALERSRPAAEDHVDRVAVLQESAGEGQHRPLDTTTAEIIQEDRYAHDLVVTLVDSRALPTI